MFMKLLVLCATVMTLVAASAIAADASRVRMMVPIQASDTASYNAGQSEPDSVSASGYSLQYVHSSGVGSSYTSSTLKKEFSSLEEEWLDAIFVDLSYTFGGEMTGQIAIGMLTGHETVTSGTTSYPLAEKLGSAFGITGVYDFGGFEVLLGYRSETVEVELEADPGKTYDASRTLINAGLGFTFQEFLRAV